MTTEITGHTFPETIVHLAVSENTIDTERLNFGLWQTLLEGKPTVGGHWDTHDCRSRLCSQQSTGEDVLF